MTEPRECPTEAAAARAVDRRTLVKGAGVIGAVVVGAAALTGCGGSQQAAEVSGPFTVEQKDVPIGGGIVDQEHAAVVTQPRKGEFKAFSATCTHQGCLVTRVEHGTIDCPCHGSRFDAATGVVVQGPAAKALPAKTLKVTGTQLEVS